MCFGQHARAIRGTPARVAPRELGSRASPVSTESVCPAYVTASAPRTPALGARWFLVVLQIWSELLLRVGTVALFTAPLAAGLVGLALMLGLAPGAQPSAGGDAWFILHVALSVLGLALLALAFISAALYVLQFRELKAKRFGQVFQLFPPLERLDRLNLVALVAGFPALTIGVLLAVGYAVRGGTRVDPAQLVWGSFTWAVLGWTVWVRVVRHWAGRRAAFASIAGFAAVVLVYIALKLAQPGTQRFL